jgi:hypothetical protein
MTADFAVDATIIGISIAQSGFAMELHRMRMMVVLDFDLCSLKTEGCRYSVNSQTLETRHQTTYLEPSSR